MAVGLCVFEEYARLNHALGISYTQILLSERAHLIESPSLLLPPGVIAGSIVNIAVHQNHAEKKRDDEFWTL